MASDVWVTDYTTSSGTCVEGHWRRSGTAGQGDDLVDESGTVDVGGWPELGAQQVADSGRDAVQQRYDQAKVQVGLATLRARRSGDRAPLEEALHERDMARMELMAAQSSTDPSGQTPDGGAGAGRCPDCGQFAAAAHRCPTPAGLPAGDYAAMTGDSRVKAMLGDLDASVKAIVESGQLGRWLDAMASNGLNRWSANNRLLAAVQLWQRGGSLDNMHLMGFRQWEKYNRRVSKGAKAVWILAPMTRKVIEENDDGTRTEKQSVFGFKSVPVFNITDTEGDPMAAGLVRPAEGDATAGTVEGLRDRVGRAGYTYEEVEFPDCRPETGDGTLGQTVPDPKTIQVDRRLGGAQKAFTIAHELGHVHCGHVGAGPGEYRKHRGQMETEAEMTAYLVCRSRGMSTAQADAFSPGYIAGWSKGDPAVMHTAVDRAVRAFNTITDGDW